MVMLYELLVRQYGSYLIFDVLVQRLLNIRYISN